MLRRFLFSRSVGFYSYVDNDPYGKTDPTGEYGRGDGWKDDKQWNAFNNAQQTAATAMEKTADSVDVKADKLDVNGKGGGDALRAEAGSLRSGAAALKSDGSDGKMANAVDAKTWASMGRSATAAAATAGNTMTVNLGNAAAWTSGTGKAQWAVGHESLHTAGLHDQVGPNGQVAYKFGDAQQKEAFRAIQGTAKATINPDSIMQNVYPNLQP